VRIIRFIKRSQELGFTLRESKELLKLRSAGPKRLSDGHKSGLPSEIRISDAGRGGPRRAG